MLEYLAMLGIGLGIKKAADGVQSATNRAARKATRAVANAPAKLGEFLDQVEAAQGRHPLERQKMCSRAPWTPCDDEVTYDDGTLTEYRCKRCKRTSRSVA